MTFVLNHDLRADIRNAYVAFLHHHGLWPSCLSIAPSPVQIVSPENLPSR